MRDPRYSTGTKMLAVATEHGDVEIFENELTSVTKYFAYRASNSIACLQRV
jgi:hypothetical protein